jgi:hypothetical protein
MKDSGYDSNTAIISHRASGYASNGGRLETPGVRTIPIPRCVKCAIDAWTAAAGVVDGRVLRPIGRGDQVHGERLAEKAVWQAFQLYAKAAGAPGNYTPRRAAQLRQNVPRGRRPTQANPVFVGPHAGPDH